MLAEIAVMAAWLAVPLFALLAQGALAPPLHAAGIAVLLTLALRAWRSARRGQDAEQTRRHLAAYLSPAGRLPAPIPRRTEGGR